MLSLLISLLVSLTFAAAAAVPVPGAVLPARSHTLQRREVQGMPLPFAWKQQMPGLNVTFGTPPQNVWLRLEMDRADVIVSVDCAECQGKGFADFRPNKSSSLVLGDHSSENMFPEFPSYNNSQIMYDSLTLGGYTVQNQTFYGIRDSSFPGQGVVGRIGLGRHSRSAAMPPNGTFVHQLAAQWDQPVFGVYLRRRRASGIGHIDQLGERLVDEGVLTFGGLNDSHYTGEVHWMDALSDGWVVQLDGIRVGNQSIDISPLPTGNISLPGNARPIRLSLSGETRTAKLPDSVVDAIYGTSYASGALGQCQAPNITFTLAGRDYTVTGEDVMFYQAKECQSGMRKVNQTLAPLSSLGSLFLQSVYSAYSFDPPRVGLATLKVTEDTMDTTNWTLHDHDTSGANPNKACAGAWALGSVAMALGAML